MDVIIQFISDVLAPLSSGIVLTAIFAGLFLGAFYNYKLNVPEEVVFHKLVAGLAFIAFIFMFRLATSAITGTAFPVFAGWLGIAILWAIYTTSIWSGEKLAKKILKKTQRKF